MSSVQKHCSWMLRHATLFINSKAQLGIDMSKRNTANMFFSAGGSISLPATFASPAYAIEANDSSSDAVDAVALSVERFRDIDPDRVAVPAASAQSTALGVQSL